MFLLYLKMLYLRKCNGGNQNVENFLVFVKTSKRHTRYMVFWKRTIIVSKKDDNESGVLTQICIAYMLISTYRWYAMSDVNVFNNIKTNVAILQYKADIANTCCKQLLCTVLSNYPSPFCGILEKVSFGKFCVGWLLNHYLANDIITSNVRHKLQ